MDVTKLTDAELDELERRVAADAKRLASPTLDRRLLKDMVTRLRLAALGQPPPESLWPAPSPPPPPAAGARGKKNRGGRPRKPVEPTTMAGSLAKGLREMLAAEEAKKKTEAE